MSRIALGTMRMENLSPGEVEKLLKECLAMGIHFLDCADLYGNTKCETLLGKVFERCPDLRNQFYLQSKVGIAFETKGYDSSYDYLINKTENCLRRLHTDHLDCLLIHRPDVLMDAGEIADAVKYLKEKGWIRDFGVSNFSPSEMDYLESELKEPVKYNQVSFSLGNTMMIDQTMYTNLPGKKASRENDGLFFYMKRKKIILQAWSPYQYGFFEGSIFDKEKNPQTALVLEKYAARYHTSPCAIATAWLLKADKNLIVITGSVNPAYIRESLDGEKIALTKEDWYRIYEECGHLLP